MAEIRAYPLKGAAGLQLSAVATDALGIPGDRRWMLVTEDGDFISQRTHPRLSLMRVLPGEGHRGVGAGGLLFTVEAPDMGSRRLPMPEPSDVCMEVRVHNDRFRAQRCGTEDDLWFSAFLGESCRLVFFPDDVLRATDPAFAPGHRTSFSDGFPLHMATTESLRHLVGRCGRVMSMDRFRPNLVISGGRPWEEDEWRAAQIGDARVEVVKPCARCAVTLVDPVTARVGEEPLAALAGFRWWGGKVYFGQNAVLGAGGSFAVGDDVHILERGPRRPPLPAARAESR